MGSIISKKTKNLNSLSRLRNATDKTNYTQKDVKKFAPTNLPAVYESAPAAEIKAFNESPTLPRPQPKNEPQSNKSNVQLRQPALGQQGVVSRVAEHATGVAIGSALGHTMGQMLHNRKNENTDNAAKSSPITDYTVNNKNEEITNQESEEQTKQEMEFSGYDDGFNDDTPEDT